MSIFIAAFRWQPLCQKQSSAFTQKLQRNFCLFLKKTYERHIVCKDYCIAHHGDKTCFLPACKYHIIVLGGIEELLHNLDTLCFTYQRVDCLYTLFKYQFSGKFNASSGNVFDNVQRAIVFNQRNGGVDKKPSMAKKRLLRIKFEQHFMSALQKKNKSKQTSSSVFAERIEKDKKTKFELELTKNVGCFLDGHDNYDKIQYLLRKKNYNKVFFVTDSKRK